MRTFLALLFLTLANTFAAQPRVGGTEVIPSLSGISTNQTFHGTNYANILNVNPLVYGAAWAASTNVPTRKDVYDKIEALVLGGGVVGADGTAIEALTGVGILTRTADGVWALRSITGDTEIVVANGAGTAGGPALSIGAGIARLANPIFTGSIQIPNAAAPTTDATGEVALDTTITDHQPLLQYDAGANEMLVIAILRADLPTTDNHALVYDAAGDKFTFEAQSGSGLTDGDKGDITVSASGATFTIDADSVALGTDTAGNYAAGDAEAGAALTGDSATAFFSTGTIEDARLPSSQANKTFTGTFTVPDDTIALGTKTTGNYAAGDAEAGAATSVANNSVTGAGIALASQVAGDIMYYDGTDWIRLAKGLAGQVLEMNAGATAPEWDTDDNSGSATAFNDIGDSAAIGVVTIAHTNLWNFSLDGSPMLAITATDADNAADTTLLRLGFNDAADANSIFVDFYSDEDGTPVSVFKVSATEIVSTLNASFGTVTSGTPSATPFIIEGLTANDFELTIAVTDPTADRTQTLPDLDGTFILSGHTFTGDVTGTLGTGGTTALTIGANTVALTTDTTGNYAAGDGEAGAALTGDTATGFFTLGQIERARGGTAADTSAYGAGLLGSDGSNNTIDVDTEAEIETALGGADIVVIATDDITSANLATAVSDETGTTLLVFSDSPAFTTKITLPNAATDATLSTAGDFHFNTTDEQISFHSAADGEISGEASVSLIYHKMWSFDPDAVCDGAVDRLFLMTVGDDLPEGMIIDEWKVSFEADPTTEVDLDLKYADAFIGVANSAVIDVLDTTAGVSSEDTDANINGGVAIANAKVLYLEFGTAYTESNHQIIFEIWFHGEED